VNAELIDVAAAPCYRIAAGDTVKLAVVRPPDGLWDATVVFEVWDPGGAQPPNSHPGSVETFWFLAGEGVATSDGAEVPVRAGTLLVLPPGSVHHIRNTGPGRLYAVTTMVPDAGFAALVAAGVPDRLDAHDVAVAQGLAG
jgi:mannose-6-phosphate isomerase-like protein (cupin superfamily)